jgi:ADP-ribosyl-[dinitrogen reductase] hydrolase
MPGGLSPSDRYRGCLLGLACGDAVGTTVEFMPRGAFPPLTDMVGGGPFRLAPGQWTDDTSMALCLGSSLLYRQGFDATDQMNRYVNWWRMGYLSATGECFDIGGTVVQALRRYLMDGNPMAGSTEPDTAGNGSLMRLAPVVLYFHRSGDDGGDDLRHHARLSSATTHAAVEALDCCELFAGMVSRALDGGGKDAVLAPQAPPAAATPAVRALAARDFLGKDASQLVASGHCVPSLEAALWCFARSSSFEETILMAANLGHDADTTAAIAGQLAGAFYGETGVPAHWLARLHMRDEIGAMAQGLLDAGCPRA